MIRRLTRNKKIKQSNSFVEPDEIFLDSTNIANFDRQQFEGRIEKPIPKRTIIWLGTVFLGVALVFGARLSYLQVQKGSAYFTRSENNVLEKAIIFTERGVIYDRNNVKMAWNDKNGDSPVPLRSYISPGFSHLLGYVSYPVQDASGNFWREDFKGKDGLEKQYNSLLSGVNGSKLIEMDALGKIYSENMVNSPEMGKNLTTSIDSRIQRELFTLIANLSKGRSFNGGSGIMIDVSSGEILASTSYPEYDSEVLSLGKDKEAISAYMNDKRKVFLDRDISGLYTPGSIVKPFFALGALAEGVIDPNKKILSTGSISIPNPYFPDQKTVFKDWRANGWTNMMEAIAVSSDVYFYEVGGGYQDQKGLGIANIGKYAKLFGFDRKTGIDLPDENHGIIPSPEWKLANFANDPWRIGDTYHTAIGQYGFQVTPIEMARAVAAIANGGKLLTPHIVRGDSPTGNEVTTLNLDPSYFDSVRQGMRMAVTFGTAGALNVPYVDLAAKTGTAQLGLAKDKVNSWVIGFFPYENPKYAFAVMMEAGPNTNSVGATSVVRGLLDWMSQNTPEYFK